MFTLLFQCADFTPGVLRIYLGALTAVNVLEIQRYGIPSVYRAGMVYAQQRGCAGKRDKKGHASRTCKVPSPVNDSDTVFFREQWRSAYVAYSEKPREGDCKVLACWRAAELQIAGERAIAFPRVRRYFDDDIGQWRNLAHILVRRGDGTIEDPSRDLGMGAEG